MKPTTLSAKSRDGILRPGEGVVQHSSFGHLATSRSILSIKTYELSQWQMADLVESNTQRKQVWQSRMCLTSSVMIHPQALPLQKACAWDWRGPGSIPSTTLTITSVEVMSTPPPLNTVSRAPLCSPESPDSLPELILGRLKFFFHGFTKLLLVLLPPLTELHSTWRAISC